MIKLVISTLMVIFASSVMAQPIVSIGNFKIGMTEEEFKEVPDIKSKKIQDFNNYGYKSTDSDVWRKTNESRNSTYSRIYLPELIEYSFKMATGVKDYRGKDLYDATAKFYKNELISINLNISISSSQFREILTEKYGKPFTENNMKKEICQNGYGAKTEHNDGSLSWIWKETGPIQASVSITSFSCGKYSGAFYNIANSSINNIVSSLEREAEKNDKIEEMKKKASSSTL